MASKVLNELTLKLNADVAELKKDLARAKGDLSGFQKHVAGIGDLIKGAFAYDSIIEIGKQVIQFGQEVMKSGAAISGVKKSFNQLNDPKLLDQLRAATGGTITDLELMRTALDASDFKVPFNELSTIMKYVRQDTQESGKNMMEVVNTLVEGLGKGSTKALSQAGIGLKEYKTELAKTGDMITAVTNIMKNRLIETGKYVETAADVTARWNTRWENMKANIGLLLNEAIVKIAPYLEEIANWYVNLLKIEAQFVVDTYNGFVDLYNESMAFRSVIETIGLAFKLAWDSVKLFFNLIVANLKNTGKLLAYVINPKNWGEGFGKGLLELMASGGKEIADDFKDFGKSSMTNFLDAANNTVKGSAKKLSFDNIINGGSQNFVKDAKDTGKKAGKELAMSFDYSFAENVQFDPTELDPANYIMDTGSTADQINEMTTNIVDATAELRSSMNALYESVGTGLANMVTGGGGLKSFFDGIISVITDFGISFGKQMIALGTASVALKAMFKNPWASIAAGIGLIAISKAVQNIVAKGAPKFAFGGIVPGYSFSGDRVPVLANSREMILSGAQQANLFKMINSGDSSNGGGVLSARVSGNDLLFILEKAKVKQSYSY